MLHCREWLCQQILLRVMPKHQVAGLAAVRSAAAGLSGHGGTLRAAACVRRGRTCSGAAHSQPSPCSALSHRSGSRRPSTKAWRRGWRAAFRGGTPAAASACGGWAALGLAAAPRAASAQASCAELAAAPRCLFFTLTLLVPPAQSCTLAFLVAPAALCFAPYTYLLYSLLLCTCTLVVHVTSAHSQPGAPLVHLW